MKTAVSVSYDVFVDGKRVGYIFQESNDDFTLHLDDMKYLLENDLDYLKDFCYNRYSGRKVSIQEA